jgi:hypothetical protein
MNDQEQFLEACEEWAKTFGGWRDAARAGLNPGDESQEGSGRGILSVDKSTRQRVWLTFGGPTAYLDVFTDEQGEVISAEYFTTYPGYADPGQRGGQTVRLTVEGAEEVADLLAITI